MPNVLRDRYLALGGRRFDNPAIHTLAAVALFFDERGQTETAVLLMDMAEELAA